MAFTGELWYISKAGKRAQLSAVWGDEFIWREASLEASAWTCTVKILGCASVLIWQPNT